MGDGESPQGSGMRPDRIAFNFCPSNQSSSLKGPFMCDVCSTQLHNHPPACVVKIKQNQAAYLLAAHTFPLWVWTWHFGPMKEISFHMGCK